MRIQSIGPAALLVASLLACGEQTPPNADTAVVTAATAADALPAGEARLAVDGGRIWYKISGGAGGVPVILLHGGPGLNSFYLKPLEALGDDRPVVRYDQLGGGKSDQATDTAMFNIAHFVHELEALRAHLGYDRVHLLGHSWGTILGLEYYRAHPEHVVSLTLGSAALDIPTWERNANRMVKTLSDSAQRAIRDRTKDGNFKAPDYEMAINEFYGKYVWRHPIKADLDSSFATMSEPIYLYMQGPSEFTLTGTLRTYDGTPYLKDVKVPTLFTVGEFDEADPPTIKRHAAMVPGARVAVIPGAAHMTTWDNPDEMTRVVRGFLRGADSLAAMKK